MVINAKTEECSYLSPTLLHYNVSKGARSVCFRVFGATSTLPITTIYVVVKFHRVSSKISHRERERRRDRDTERGR